MKRSIVLLGVLLAAAAVIGGGTPSFTPATPIITEPDHDGQTISPFDVHMVTQDFVGAPGETHVCSDWEIHAEPSDETVWQALCVSAGALKVHIHLGDGTFMGSLSGHHQLDYSHLYKLLVRHKGDEPAPDGTYSDWAERAFQTATAYAIEPMVLSDASTFPGPTWLDSDSHDVILPSGSPAPSLRLEVPGGGTILEFDGTNGAVNRFSNPSALTVHGPLHVVCSAAGAAAVHLPASSITFTDGSGEDRAVYLPVISLSAGQQAGFWIAEGGGAYTADAIVPPNAVPDFTTPVSDPPIPWAVKQPGYRVELVATGLQLPVDIAFVPNRGSGANDPFFYVTELYGSIAMVTGSGQVSDYATNLLNFDPTGSFPGSGEKGLAGIVVEPQSGDVFASMVEAVPPTTDVHFPRVVRLHSLDGGKTAASQMTILDFPTEALGPSHQISNLSIGPDGKLYVHIGDGMSTSTAQDLNSARGKILRVNLDGSAPVDNPFYNAADGITVTDLIFAYGFRNPFGGIWRADGTHWEVENGPSVDRLAQVVAGRNYLWDGTDASMLNYAAYNWPVAVAPVNIAFIQSTTYGGSGFPADKLDHAFVAESGPTYAPGPQALGKRVSEFVLDPAGNLVSGPLPLIEFIGAGRATVVGLTAGPDGLYFTDLYKDFGALTPIDAGANVFRIRYIGVPDFSADAASGAAPLTVSFQDQSAVPGATAWHWDFGDGTSSDERNPVHVYEIAGSLDVRLTVTGSGGPASRQKAAFVVVSPTGRGEVHHGVRPPTRIVPPRG